MNNEKKLFYNSDVNILKILDDLRVSYGVSVTDFTKGVVSKRNYSRYLNGEVKINFSILSNLLEKINVSISEFSYFVANTIIVKYEYEIDFFNHVVKRDYKKASMIYEKSIKGKQLCTHYATIAIPCALIFLEYQLKQIDLQSARFKMSEVVSLDYLLNKHIYTNNLIGGLFFYSKIANCKEKEKIEEFLIDFVVKGNRKNFSLSNEESNYLIYTMFLDLLTSKEEIDENTKKTIEIVTSKALDFDRRARLYIYHLYILEILYKYANKENLKNKELYSYYYIMCLLSINEEEVINHSFDVKKEDYELFMKNVKEDEYIYLEMYEGIINDDYL